MTACKILALCDSWLTFTLFHLRFVTKNWVRINQIMSDYLRTHQRTTLSTVRPMKSDALRPTEQNVLAPPRSAVIVYPVRRKSTTKTYRVVPMLSRHNQSNSSPEDMAKEQAPIPRRCQQRSSQAYLYDGPLYHFLALAFPMSEHLDSRIVPNGGSCPWGEGEGGPRRR